VGQWGKNVAVVVAVDIRRRVNLSNFTIFNVKKSILKGAQAY